MTPEQVERVAQILFAEANVLRAAHTLADGSWQDDHYGKLARRDYIEYLALARAAQQMVDRYWAARGNAPKGGA